MKRLFTLTLMVMATVAVYAQGSIMGTVKGSDGAGIPFASVELVGTTNGAMTDADGKYSIGNVPVGKVTVRASAISHASSDADLEVANGKEAQQDFTLAGDALDLGQTVVTGVRNERSKLESSVSISTLSASAIQNTGAMTTAEIFRSIPGIRSEASGGEGNTNMTARGVPISSGGSKYLQLQEDGLPVLMFGDMAFATADIFTRADQSVSRIEVIRGGSASTASTNSPAGIINFISNTGATRGGSIATSFGLNYNNFRTDFNFGTPLGDGVSMHVGGFFRQGEGQRTAGYTANQGGQIKMNLTKTFKNGYARIYYKFLNDRAAAYMPMPIKVDSTGTIWSNASNSFDPLTGTMHSPYMLQNYGLGSDGQLRNANVADGMHPNSNSVGAEFSFDLDGWKVEDRARMSFNSGRFVTPFPAEIGRASALAASVASLRNDTAGTAPAKLMYAGTNKEYNGDSLALRIHMFDTELNNFDNMVNDVKISKKFNILNVSVGYFNSLQNVNMSWLWNSYITEMNGNGARMLDVVRGANNLSQNGQYAYGVPYWGNCCQRSINTQNTTSAPYINLGVDITENLNFDGSLRYDMGKVTGSYASGAQSAIDMNHDGVIQAAETSVSSINHTAAMPVNYTYSYLSYSLGLNYKIDKDMAVFARYSQGGSAKADRILFGSDLNTLNGSLLTLHDSITGKQILEDKVVKRVGTTVVNARPYDVLTQAELGLKYRFNNGGLYFTGFYSTTDETAGFEATSQKYISNNYRAFGAEIEAAYSVSNFNLRAGITYINASIISTDTSKNSLNGHTPRRQPALMYNLTPSYKFSMGEVGLNIYGNTESFTQDVNKLVMPGYVVLNLFANFNVTKSIVFGVSGNNLLNSLGLTEAEEGAILNKSTAAVKATNNNYVRARSIPGRTFSASVRYNF